MATEHDLNRQAAIDHGAFSHGAFNPVSDDQGVEQRSDQGAADQAAIVAPAPSHAANQTDPAPDDPMLEGPSLGILTLDPATRGLPLLARLRMARRAALLGRQAADQPATKPAAAEAAIERQPMPDAPLSPSPGVLSAHPTGVAEDGGAAHLDRAVMDSAAPQVSGQSQTVPTRPGFPSAQSAEPSVRREAPTAVADPARTPPLRAGGGMHEMQMLPRAAHDLVIADPQQVEQARALQQARVVVQWTSQPHAMTTDLDHQGIHREEPLPYRAAADALATGCASPISAFHMLHQVEQTMYTLMGGIPKDTIDQRMTKRTARALVQELDPRSGLDGALCTLFASGHLVASRLLQHVAHTAEAQRDDSPQAVALYAEAAGRVTGILGDLQRMLKRNRTSARTSRTKIVIRDQAQAVIGDVDVRAD